MEACVKNTVRMPYVKPRLCETTDEDNLVSDSEETRRRREIQRHLGDISSLLDSDSLVTSL